MMNKTMYAICMAGLMGFNIAPAYALSYTYESGANTGFYESTSVTADSISNSSNITVGSDGTITAYTDENVTSKPLSSFTLPVGEYPDSWGKETDIAIAQNSIFPNALAPTTQMSNVAGNIQYDTGRINSSALPTPSTSSATSNINNYTGTGYASGVSTKDLPMQSVASDGAIGHISIPSVGISEYIYEDTSTASMRKGVAHFDETPGWEGNVGLAGHNRGSYETFGGLKNISLGSVVNYTTAYGTKQYKVVYIGTCSTTDTSGLLQDGSNKITMYTCVENNPSLKRIVVAVEV